jgi:hypothetical protein
VDFCFWESVFPGGVLRHVTSDFRICVQPWGAGFATQSQRGENIGGVRGPDLRREPMGETADGIAGCEH